jgi:hypothetical protein
MKRINLALAATTLLFCVSAGAFAQSGLEVTLQVLDDISDIDGVIMAIERTSRRDEEAAEAKSPRQPPPQSEELPAARESRLGQEFDREEESEGELDDFDVPDDIDPTTL